MLLTPTGATSQPCHCRYDCVQPRYNLLHRDIEAELLPLCRDQGLGVIAYNPLAGGFLLSLDEEDRAACDLAWYSLPRKS